VIKTITDRAIVAFFFEVDPDPQFCFLQLNFPSIVDNGTVTVAAKFVFLNSQLGSLYIGPGHRPHGGERYGLASLPTARTERYISLHRFTDRTAV